jgi:hypothetical protein
VLLASCVAAFMGWLMLRERPLANELSTSGDSASEARPASVSVPE